MLSALCSLFLSWFVLAIFSNAVSFVNGIRVGSENAGKLRNRETDWSFSFCQEKKKEEAEKPWAGVLKELSGGGEDNEGDIGIA